MNIQELQTIRQNHLPIKLFVINNQGYHSIRQTQQSYFGEPLVGVGQESGDLSFPDLQKLIPAYGFPYRCIHSSEKLADTIKEVLEMDGAAVCEVFVTRYQKTEPKTSSKKLPDGKWCLRLLRTCIRFFPGRSWKKICTFLFRSRSSIMSHSHSHNNCLNFQLPGCRQSPMLPHRLIPSPYRRKIHFASLH